MHDYPFERLTPNAKLTLQLAQQEAERGHRTYVGTEHILLGLLRLEGGSAHRALNDLGVSIAPVRMQIRSTTGRGRLFRPRKVIPTARVKEVVELAFAESRRMAKDSVHSGHLLMGLAMARQGVAAQVLDLIGASRERVFAAAERQIGAAPEQTR